MRTSNRMAGAGPRVERAEHRPQLRLRPPSTAARVEHRARRTLLDGRVACSNVKQISLTICRYKLKRMRLHRVAYGLFEHEAGATWPAEADSWHHLDGEVVLTFSDGATEFISWSSEPVQYSVGRSATTPFLPEVLQSVDMTTHPMWREIVDSDVSLRFMDDERQVLQIASGARSVFISSQYEDGVFLGDCVRVSAKNPL